ncbi:hypothetical protein TYRP_016520 [Tyrophagus putrescentiae]|nr:hypothetical protein TYRP_016520 [Tyrophagus putrescentiae]
MPSSSSTTTTSSPNSTTPPLRFTISPICADFSQPNGNFLFGSCGVQECNLFACACKDGCRPFIASSPPGWTPRLNKIR